MNSSFIKKGEYNTHMWTGAFTSNKTSSRSIVRPFQEPNNDQNARRIVTT